MDITDITQLTYWRNGRSYPCFWPCPATSASCDIY